MTGKGQVGKKRKPVNLDEIQVVSNETDVPCTYFAGVAQLNVSWLMNPVIAFTRPSGGGGKGKSSGGKDGSGSNDTYIHCAGITCGCQMDFIWGFMADNDLVWPKAKDWNSQIHQKNKITLYTDGNVYQTTEKTDIDPPTAPWALYAIPWVAGTTHAGDKVISGGNVWQAAVDTVTMPPADPPAQITNGRTMAFLGVQTAVPVGDWIYLCTPALFSAATHFWPANSIVAHNARLWINSADTNKEPGTDPVWTLWRQVLVGGPNPFKFTVENNGDVFQYLGTSDQTLDTVDEKILNALGHPPYRYRAVTMLKNFLAGSGTSNPRNITVLAGRTPIQTLIIDNSAVVGVDATVMDADWQVNPWTVLAELLTDPVIGLGLPASWFDAASWQAEADRCAANPELFYISALYTSLQDVRQLVADLMGYPDAFIFWSAVATLKAGHWPHHEAAPAFTNDTTIDRNDLINEIESDSEGWGGTANAVALSFRDIEAGFTSRPAQAPNLFNRTVTRRLTVKKIDRPFIVRFDQALAWATEAAKIAGDQTFACNELVVRAEKAAAIEAGSLFLLTDDVLQMSWVMRCTKKTVVAAGTGQAKLTCELERGVAPAPYMPTPTTTLPLQGPAPAAIINFAAVQLPAALAGAANTLAVLASRENTSTSSFQIWFRESDAAAFQQLGTGQGFAVAGVFDIDAESEIITSTAADNVTAVNVGAVTQGDTYDLGNTDFWKIQVSYSANSNGIPGTPAIEGVDFAVDPTTGILTILTGGGIATGKFVHVKLWQSLVIRYNTNTPQADLDAISTVPTQDEIADGEILLIAFQVNNPALFEIMSVRSVTAAGNGNIGTPVFFVKVLRTRFSTLFGGDGSYNWGTNGNDVVMIIRKSDIQALTHQNFPFYHANGTEIHLRLAPASVWDQADVTDLIDPANNPAGLTTAFDYTFNNLYAPTVTWGELLNNGAAISDFTTNFAAADVFSFTFEIDAREGNIVNVALVAVQGQEERTLWATNITPAPSYNASVEFSLPKGNWAIQIRALDDSGNQLSTPLIVGGTPVTLYVDNGTAAAPILYTKGASHNGFQVGVEFGLLPGVAADFQVQYQLQDRNVAVNPSDWVNCAVDGAAIGGLYKWGDADYITLPPVKRGSNGKTLYAKCTQTGKTDSDVMQWNF